MQRSIINLATLSQANLNHTTINYIYNGNYTTQQGEAIDNELLQLKFEVCFSFASALLLKLLTKERRNRRIQSDRKAYSERIIMR